VDAMGKLQELQLATLRPDDGECGDQFTQPRAVDVVHIFEVHYQLSLTGVQQLLKSVA
jgi:hypothetical protein